MHAPGVSGHFLQKMIKMMILESLLQNMRSYFQYAKFFSLGFSGQESASNAGDLGSIPGLGIPMERGKATHSNILVWRIPWSDKESDMTE